MNRQSRAKTTKRSTSAPKRSRVQSVGKSSTLSTMTMATQASTKRSVANTTVSVRQASTSTKVVASSNKSYSAASRVRHSPIASNNVNVMPSARFTTTTPAFAVTRPAAVTSIAAPQFKRPSMTAPVFNRKAMFATLDVPCPPLGDSVLEGDVLEWKKNIGDWVNEDDTLCVLETAKVVIDIPAPKGGLLKEQRIAVGEVANVGDVLAVLDPDAAKPAGAGSAAAAPKKAAPAADTKAPEPAAAAAPSKPAPAAATSTSAIVDAVETASTREDRRVKMTRMRQTIAQRLKDSQNTMAILSTFNEVDMTNAMALRAEYKDAFEKKHGVKLGFMSIFMAASASALQKFPDVNAYIDGNDVVYRNYVDISIAVSTPTGLVVPVVRDVQQKSFADLEKAVGDFGARARKGTIAMEEFVGGTFTISNGGVYGSLFGTPIINPPQSAILGMHGIKDRAVVVDGKIEARKMMYVALSYDHRLIDGATGVQFLKHIKDCVEDPRRLLVDL